MKGKGTEKSLSFYLCFSSLKVNDVQKRNEKTK